MYPLSVQCHVRESQNTMFRQTTDLQDLTITDGILADVNELGAWAIRMITETPRRHHPQN